MKRRRARRNVFTRRTARVASIFGHLAGDRVAKRSLETRSNGTSHARRDI